MENTMPPLTTYPVHEAAAQWAVLPEDEMQKFEDSIVDVGLKVAVTTWTHPVTKITWLIDGQLRQILVKRLRAKGVTTAKNGQPIDLLVWPFEGTELDVLNEVKRQNLRRRQATTSQRAAQAVLDEALRIKYGAAATTETGDKSDALAAEFCTNRQYVFDCRLLRDDAPDLLELVAAGVKNVLEAMRGMTRKKRGLVPFPTEAEMQVETAPAVGVTKKKSGDAAKKSDAGSSGDSTAPVEPSPAPKLPDVLDGEKLPVADEFRAIFGTSDEFKAVIKDFRSLSADVKALGDGVGGKHLHVKDIQTDIGNITRALRDNMPHVVCTNCKGEGFVELAECNLCHGAKYLDRVTYGLVPAEIKAGGVPVVVSSEPTSASAPVDAPSATPEPAAAVPEMAGVAGSNF
jgi:hypothetical protein